MRVYWLLRYVICYFHDLTLLTTKRKKFLIIYLLFFPFDPSANRNIAQVFCNKIIRFLEDPSDSVSLIRDGDQLAAYRLSKELEESPLIVFMHQTKDEQG